MLATRASVISMGSLLKNEGRWWHWTGIGVPTMRKRHCATITTAPRARKPRNPGRHAGPLVAADATMGRHPHPPLRHATDPLRPARLGPPRLDAARRRRAI